MIAGVAEHQALVAGADFLSLGRIFIYPLGDIRTLAADAQEHSAGIAADAHGVVGISDVADTIANDFAIIDLRVTGDFAGNQGQPGGDQGFAGHAAVRILRQERVENAIGNLVGQLVGMPHANRFTSEQKFAGCHEEFSYRWGRIAANLGFADPQQPLASGRK